MGALYSGGMCCLCLSIWAVIQLTLMGFFYSIEASTLVDDVEAEKYNDISDYLSITKANFQKISGVCYYTAYIYVVMILVSWYMISRGKSNDRKAAEKAYAEESLCGTLDDPNSVVTQQWSVLMSVFHNICLTKKKPDGTSHPFKTLNCESMNYF